MNLDIFNVDQYTKEMPEVINPKIFESGKFARDGLFSQQIFGPVKSYYCVCNRATYRGRSNTAKKCTECNVDITNSEERRKRYAKITLPFPILNPIFYYIITTSKTTLKTIIDDMLNYTNHYFYNIDDIITKETDTIKPIEGTERLIGLKGVITIIEKFIENSDKQEFQFIRDNFDKISFSNVIVIPPDFRPCGNNNTGIRVIDEINQLYSTILIRSNNVKSIQFQVNESNEIYRSNFKHIQQTVIKLYDYILKKMSKKKGLIRSNILGKRLDFSGRAVISPNPNLTIDTCKVPYWMILEILKPQLSAYLVNRRVCKRYNQSVKLIEDCIKSKDTQLFNIVEEFCVDKVCILNRQPTLHRLGILAFKVSTHLGNTVQIHPMVCSPFNADFDGDAMAIYFPATEAGIKDAKEKLGIWNNLVSPTDISIVPRPDLDIILGIYALSSNDSKDNLKEIKGKKLPFGKYLINQCFPEDYRLIDEPLKDKELMNLLNDVALHYSPDVVMETLDKIKSLGFTHATLKGYTLGIDDLYSDVLDGISADLTGNVQEDIAKMNSDEVMVKLREFPFAEFVDSGARGNWDQVRQIVLARGYVSDISGKIRPNLIRSSLIKGLNQEEFFNSCYGSRKGLLDTALSTGDSGYLTRKLIYSTISMELGTDDDCGTDDYLEVKVDDEAMARTLWWRYRIAEDNHIEKITSKNYKSIVGTTVKLRSPIYCQDRKLCKKCYGDLYKILHSDQVGIIATQAVGERTTQLVLRTFHLGGVAQAASGTQTDDQEDIISGIGMANTIFHKPGSLDNINGPFDLVKCIYEIFNPYKGIHLIHYEIIVSCMMFAGKTPWRLHELRKETPYTWTSILQIPSKNSWLIGLAFSNLKQKLLDGLVNSRTDEPSAISDLFRF